jgi:hypothetical protein
MNGYGTAVNGVAFSETTRIPYPKLYKKLNSNLNM